MKLIIDIPQEEYEKLSFLDVPTLVNFIRNGTPFDDIKEEIESEKIGFDIYDNHDKDVLYGLQIALEIIDKHIGERSKG